MIRKQRFCHIFCEAPWRQCFRSACFRASNEVFSLLLRQAGQRVPASSAPETAPRKGLIGTVEERVIRAGRIR